MSARSDAQCWKHYTHRTLMVTWRESHYQGPGSCLFFLWKTLGSSGSPGDSLCLRVTKSRTLYIMTVILRGDSESQVIVASDYGMSTHNWLASICTSFPIHFITLHLLFTPHYAKGPSFYQVQKDKPPNRSSVGAHGLDGNNLNSKQGLLGNSSSSFLVSKVP